MAIVVFCPSCQVRLTVGDDDRAGCTTEALVWLLLDFPDRFCRRVSQRIAW